LSSEVEADEQELWREHDPKVIDYDIADLDTFLNLSPQRHRVRCLQINLCGVSINQRIGRCNEL